jgi:signal transduction histidine kinase
LKNTGCQIMLNCPQMIIVETAPGALYQIITNLVMNSITHGFAKGRSPSDAEAMDGRERPADAMDGRGGSAQGIDGRAEPAEATDAREGLSAAAGGLITIDVRRDDAQIFVDFRDNGRGMEEAVRARIFEPFFTTRRGQGGSGLGMHIVYNLVTQILRGTIECISSPGEGVLFRIVMPATPVGKTGLRADG